VTCAAFIPFSELFHGISPLTQPGLRLRRAFLPRLSMSAEVGHCVAMTWSGYATMQVRGIMPTPKEKKMQEQLKKILSLVDVNQDAGIGGIGGIGRFSKIDIF